MFAQFLAVIHDLENVRDLPGEQRGLGFIEVPAEHLARLPEAVADRIQCFVDRDEIRVLVQNPLQRRLPEPAAPETVCNSFRMAPVAFVLRDDLQGALAVVELLDFASISLNS